MRKEITVTIVMGLVLVQIGACGTSEVGVPEETEVVTSDTFTDIDDEYYYDWGWDWGEYDAWDTDGDGITEVEWTEGFDTVYTTWDVDGDGFVETTYLWDESYDWWDVDDDELVDEDEYVAYTDTWDDDWGYDYEWPGWDDADVDGDGYLGTTEYQELFNEEAWNGVWDADGDGVVGADEAADTFWDLFDGDDDNLVDENEYDLWVS